MQLFSFVGSLNLFGRELELGLMIRFTGFTRGAPSPGIPGSFDCLSRPSGGPEHCVLAAGQTSATWGPT